MPRVDYYNDPQAPAPNSLVPSVSAAVRDDDGRLLMVHHEEIELWSLPGGGINPGETVADAVVRAVGAEAGQHVEVTGMVGIYTNPHHVVAYDDGEVRQEFSVCFHGRPRAGDARPDGPNTRWVDIEQLDDLPVHPAVRTRINDALGDRPRPRIA
jgi:ADP-ribose pyrophosphatase YjhB (NUDIX family)